MYDNNNHIRHKSCVSFHKPAETKKKTSQRKTIKTVKSWELNCTMRALKEYYHEATSRKESPSHISQRTKYIGEKAMVPKECRHLAPLLAGLWLGI